MGNSGKKARSDAEPRKRVLIVEDNPINQRILAKIVEGRGYETVIAENGLIAENVFEAAEIAGTTFDLIFMDLQMPVQDGYATIESIRGSGFETPIVVLTAHLKDSERERCFDLGCDGFAAKPYTKREILAFLESFARR